MDVRCKLTVCELSLMRQNNLLFSALSFELQSGQLLLIEGENGSGKSSLLRLLTGLSSPLAGEIAWQDQTIQQCAPLYREQFHYVGHSNGIKLGLTVLENLQLMHHLALTPPTSQSYESVLAAWQLDKAAHQLAAHLSSGQKRKLGLAKLFLWPKPLWILDEPLTALDLTSQTLFLTHLKTHLQHQGLVVMSSHHALDWQGVDVQRLRLGAC